MFCSNCGNKVEDTWLKCPYCGSDLQESLQGNETVEAPGNDNTQVVAETGDGGSERRGAANSERARDTGIQKKPAHKKGKLLIGLCVLMGVLLVISVIFFTFGNGGRNSGNMEADTGEIIEKLQKFTTVSAENNKYLFRYEGGNRGEENGWILTYTTENEFVSFKNDSVVECFTETFGAGCFSAGSASNSGFSYDLSDDEARIYFDVDIEDGHLTIVSYNFADKEYELMIDGDKWSATETFTNFVKEYGLAQAMESDVKEFEEILQQHELTVEDLLGVTYAALEKAQFVSDSDKEQNDNSKEASNNNGETSELPERMSLGWKEAYLNYLKENGNTEYGYSLEYIDGDDIPELVIDYKYTAGGMALCTYDGEKIIVNHMGGYLRYRLQENLMCTSGGRMDAYYDIVYKIVDGTLTEISRGEYGISDYKNIEYDETGSMIYEYFWNGEKVSESEYDTFLEAFNEEEGLSVIYSSGSEYLYDVMGVLSHPQDITMINPYLNHNGYESLLNHYDILFDGIEDDKIHFTVMYENTLIASASATIIDAKTAKFKNANSELVIKFYVDYKKLNVEGYIDTIDLTGAYSGRWG